MKSKFFFYLLLPVLLLADNFLFSQTQVVYKLPDTYHFDYEVTQVLVSTHKKVDSSVMHFYYTKNGEYSAARLSKKKDGKESLLVILNRDGNISVIDEHRKNITLISVRKIMSDISGLSKWIKMDSLVAHFRNNKTEKNHQSVKTGRTMQVSNYTAEEYIVSDNKGHQASVWCAKVDFPTPLDYILTNGVGNLLKMMNERQGQPGHPLFQALIQPKTLVTSIETKDSLKGKGLNLTTQSINQVSTTIGTEGYQVDDYSNMTIMEIFQAEMQKKHGMK